MTQGMKTVDHFKGTTEMEAARLKSGEGIRKIQMFYKPPKYIELSRKESGATNQSFLSPIVLWIIGI